MGPLVDAMRPGGDGDPFAGLDTHEREELATLYRLGFPRGDEHMIAAPMGQIWLWSSIADQLAEQDPDYFESFWTSPGYVGHDLPSAVQDDVIDVVTTVDRVITVGELLHDPDFAGPDYELLRNTAQVTAATAGPDLPFAVELRGLPNGYRLGAGLRPATGTAAGRRLYCTGAAGDLLTADGHGEANLHRFRGVRPGDEIHVDNRRFLAFCYFHRHHLMEDPQFDALRAGGVPVYPQHPVPSMSPLMGVSYTGRYEGKLLWIHHTHDSSLWPPQGIVYADAVLKAQGAEAARENFRLQWTENAEHVPPQFIPRAPTRSCDTWLVDYFPIIEQGLADLISWVEDGVAPPETRFEYAGGQVTLPPSAAERGGVQPTAAVTANGSVRTKARSGDPVTLEVRAQAPPAGGTIISVEWDFDGTGAFPFQHEVGGKDATVRLSTTHTYDKPGTYFATARVTSHRDGRPDARFRRLTNVASARIIIH
jgi:hypothetical protein